MNKEPRPSCTFLAEPGFFRRYPLIDTYYHKYTTVHSFDEVASLRPQYRQIVEYAPDHLLVCALHILYLFQTHH